MYGPALLFAVSIASLGNPVLAKTVVTDLPIVNTVISPDGFSRSSVLAGGTFPGPVISGFKGDSFHIKVTDELVDKSMVTDTSVHWHGISQNGTNFEDGTSSVTQCPITPGNSFTYNFTVPDQAGTFWYHSHLSTQYCDGLRGALILYDRHDPHAHLYDIDNESTIITLADWYHDPAPSQGFAPAPNSTLINGLGRWPGGPESELAVIEVEHGKRYRFRLIGMSCHSSFNFTVDGHSMLAIEADGVNTGPVPTDQVTVFTGQRYSVILEANQTIDNYWIRAIPNRGNANITNGLNSAILRYKGAPQVDPAERNFTSVAALNETSLHPLTALAAPGSPSIGGADVVLNLDMGFLDATNQFTINGAVFVPPTTPVLLQILSGAKNATDLLPSGSVFPLPRNKVIEISMPGKNLHGSPHPFHLHGHDFSVVRSAGSTAYNYANPVRRDTVNLGSDLNDNVTIRFTTDNPGPWFFHCHVDWHLETGLAIVFAEDIGDTASHSPVTQEWKDLCPTYNAAHPGNATSNTTST
ncbi:hypothetical protein PLICRDRAFT_115284 [Plicaturopsis crispa FD-325 SS-3]|nr:hypothetical protein PLICRDRAFT_115284 [Plicaturopsis crispa FD-325 SS-3]